MNSGKSDNDGSSHLSGGLEAMYILWGDDIFSDPFYFSLSEEAQMELHAIAQRVRVVGRETRRAQIIARNAIKGQEGDQESALDPNFEDRSAAKKSDFNWGGLLAPVIWILIMLAYWLR